MCDPLGLVPLSLLALVAAAQLGRALRPAAGGTGDVPAENHPVITPDHPVISGDRGVISGDFGVIAASRPVRSAHAAAQARYKAKCKALGRAYGTLRRPETSGAAPAATAERVISGDHPASSLSLFKEDALKQEPKKETKPRARAGDHPGLRREFDGFIAGWPVQTPVEPAWLEYRAARRSASAEELADGRDDYIAVKPPGIAWCGAARWLRERRWRDRLARAQPALLMGIAGGKAAAPPAHALGEAGDRLLRRIGAAEFAAWAAALAIERTEAGELRLVAPSGFVRSQLLARYEDELGAAFGVGRIEIAVRRKRLEAG